MWPQDLKPYHAQGTRDPYRARILIAGKGLKAPYDA
jgi:hypothetical protein